MSHIFEASTNSEFALTAQDKPFVAGIVDKMGPARKEFEKFSVISEAELPIVFSDEEIACINRVALIDPRKYGFKGPEVGIEPVPDNLIRIEGKEFYNDGKPCLTDIQYLPNETYTAFCELSNAYEADTDTGRQLLIASSYRSNAYQALLFLKYLVIYDFDMVKTIRRVAVPGYSEHTTPSKLAIDFMNIDGAPTTNNPQDFENTPEYEWLLRHAGRFDFYMSYPKDNESGVMFEPWHWRYIPHDTM